MKVTITFEVDELDSYGDETLEVIKDAVDHDLDNLEVWARNLTIKVEP